MLILGLLLLGGTLGTPPIEPAGLIAPVLLISSGTILLIGRRGLHSARRWYAELTDSLVEQSTWPEMSLRKRIYGALGLVTLGGVSVLGTAALISTRTENNFPVWVVSGSVYAGMIIFLVLIVIDPKLAIRRGLLIVVALAFMSLPVALLSFR